MQLTGEVLNLKHHIFRIRAFVLGLNGSSLLRVLPGASFLFWRYIVRPSPMTAQPSQPLITLGSAMPR